jgi:chemotaxis protein CheC
MLRDLLPEQRDALKQLGSIGASYAASSFASLLSRDVSATVPSIEIMPLSQLWSGAPACEMIVTRMAMTGDVDGHIMIAFERNGSIELAVGFIRRLTRTESPSESDVLSTLQEFGNILAGSYLMAVASLTKLRLGLSIPTVSSGTSDHVLASLCELEGDRDIVVIESQFVGDGLRFPGQVILVPFADAIESLVSPMERVSAH